MHAYIFPLTTPTHARCSSIYPSIHCLTPITIHIARTNRYAPTPMHTHPHIYTHIAHKLIDTRPRSIHPCTAQINTAHVFHPTCIHAPTHTFIHTCSNTHRTTRYICVRTRTNAHDTHDTHKITHAHSSHPPTPSPHTTHTLLPHTHTHHTHTMMPTLHIARAHTTTTGVHGRARAGEAGTAAPGGGTRWRGGGRGGGASPAGGGVHG